MTVNNATVASTTPQRDSAKDAPPHSIEFPVQIGGSLARYHHSVDSNDLDAGVLGKGGFGCVYRYALDPSFSPPSSLDLTQTSQSVELRPSSRHAAEQIGSGKSPLRTRTKPRSPVPSVVAVKVCRTPCSGSFDELPKTSLLDKRKRRADMLDDRLSHVRIVRGEGRIFAYLQAARQRSSRLTDPPLVKLLANLPQSGQNCSSDMHNDIDEDSDEEDGPPTRLLVFEKMVELDSKLTARGWVRSDEPWTHAQVEKAAIEIIQGLQVSLSLV